MGMLKEGTEDKLVMLASGGNSLAKNTLMSRYQPFVLRLVKKMKVDDADDVAQDILIKVMLNLHRFESRSLFSTWLYRITTNHVLQLKKKERRLTSIDSLKFDVAPPESEGLNREKVRWHMCGIMTCLQPDQRITIILADQLKLDHNAAAQELNITPANFRKRLSRARKDLQQWNSNQCSLMGGKGCLCSKKKRHFVEQGWVDPATQKFTKERLTTVNRIIQMRYQLED